MSKPKYLASKRRLRSRTHSSRGAALVSSLLLLLLLSAMTVAMVLSTNSDMLTNGYYDGFRGAFYAADSGLNIVRQDMKARILAASATTFSGTTQPIPPGTESSVASYLNTTYGSSYQSLNGGQASGSWKETFMLDTSGTVLGVPTCTVLGGGGTCAAPTGTVTGYSYVYPYSLRAMGRSTGNQVTSISDSGTITFNIVGTGGSTTVNFAAYGTFIDQYAICSAAFVPGTLTGPVFTNGAWTFSDSGPYIFTDSVGSVSANAGYAFTNGPCDQKAASSDTYKKGKNSTTIAPQFQSGFNLGQNPIPLPQNDFSQKEAVLDSLGNGSTTVNNSTLNAALKNINKSPYPSTGASSGVYLPYTVDSSGKASFAGGGIYVEGSASVKLSTSGATGQVYTITQGGTVTTITVDSGINQTTVVSNGTTLTISGVPVQLDPTTGAVTRDATMLYVDGSITSLSGPGEGVPAIQDGSAVTITAASNVTVTGDIVYKTKPVTTTQNQIPGTPADTLIPGNNNGQVLGIFTATGDIQMNNSQADGNLEIDASIAMISQGGSGGWINTGPHINTLTLLGGRIANQAKNGNTTTRNIFFDRRFAQNGFAPPWYPSTTVTSTAATVATPTVTVQRLRWINNTSYY